MHSELYLYVSGSCIVPHFEEGTALEPENLQEMPAFQGSKLHISAEISWYKIGELQFYNDENDPPEVVVKKPKKRKPTKPRQKESQGQFEQRLREWEAEKEAQQPHDPEIKPKGNSMTQAYYTKRLLPIYIRSCQQALDTGDIAVNVKKSITV